MPIDRPTPLELLEAIREHLTERVAPLLEGQPAFHLRVATNALAIVERTIADGDDMDGAELLRLRALLDDNGDLMTLNERLADQIREDRMGSKRAQVLDHLRQTVLDKVRLANPRYLQSRD